jgi:hypothetical protein
MNDYLVIGTKDQIWVVNPENKRRMLLNPIERDRSGAHERSNILDIYSSGSGVYHALEKIGVGKESGFIRGKWVDDRYNFVQVYDSISLKPILTVKPHEAKTEPVGKRIIDNLKFSFLKKDNSLLYVLNGIEGLVFSNINGYTLQSGKTEIKGDVVYYGGEKITSIEGVIYTNEVDSERFERSFKKKNRNLYKGSRLFF